MTPEQKEFVTNLYNKMLEGYFDIDDFKKAFNIINNNQNDNPNIIKMRRTISSFVNLDKLNEENGNTDNETPNTIPVTNTEQPVTVIDNTPIDTTIQNTEPKPKNKGGRPKGSTKK
jgi:hypothetical protein